jgi:excisionase family DNA binding protein
MGCSLCRERLVLNVSISLPMSGATRYHRIMDHVTVAQAAEELGLTPDGVRDRIQRGLMHAVRVNPRLLMIPREEVERWKGKGKLKTGPKPKREPSS